MKTNRARFFLSIISWFIIASSISLVIYGLFKWFQYHWPTLFPVDDPNYNPDSLSISLERRSVLMALYNLIFVQLFACVPLLFFIKFVLNAKIGKTFTPENIKLLTKM